MIRQVAVLGAGTMGHGIAGSFALGGYPVALFDVSSQALSGAMAEIRKELEFLAAHGLAQPGQADDVLERITCYSDMEQAVRRADYVIEATPEDMELKQRLFAQLDEWCGTACVLASNTSSLALSEIMEHVSEERRKRMMVCHWYNPPHLMPLVELSCFGNMDDAVCQEVEELYHKIGKQTIKVKKDVPGLVANRIQQGVAREVFSIMEQGIADPEEVEKALKFGPAFRYATTGQLEVADMGGLDIWCTVGDNLLAVMDNRQEANPILREKVAQGKLGVKSGEGFFSYTPERAEQVKQKFYERLAVQLKASENYV